MIDKIKNDSKRKNDKIDRINRSDNYMKFKKSLSTSNIVMEYLTLGIKKTLSNWDKLLFRH